MCDLCYMCDSSTYLARLAQSAHSSRPTLVKRNILPSGRQNHSEIDARLSSAEPLLTTTTTTTTTTTLCVVVVLLLLVCLQSESALPSTSSTMPPSTRSGWINWNHSKPQKILLRDLEPGGPLHEMDHIPARDVFTYYKQFPEFDKVVFSQFEVRLEGHRGTSERDRKIAARDREAMLKDRRLLPRSRMNERGELVFDLHPAKKLLRKDVKNKVHEQMPPSAMRQSRPAYMKFTLKIFTHRIYQEVRRQKFLHFLDLKRQREHPLREAGPRAGHTNVALRAIHVDRRMRETRARAGR